MFGGGYKSSKLRVNLRLAINRLKLLQKKKTEQAVKARKEIADYLSNAKVDRARIRVEHIIREDYMVEAMEVLEMYCDLILARFGLIETMKYCEEGLSEAVCTLIWVAPRLQADIPEMKLIADQFMLKFGKTFSEQARTNGSGSVNERIILRMGVQAPPRSLVENYLVEIARSHNVAFEPDPDSMLDDGIPPVPNEKSFFPYGDDFRGSGGNGGSSGGGGGGGMVAPMPVGPSVVQHVAPMAMPVTHSAPPPAMHNVPPASAGTRHGPWTVPQNVVPPSDPVLPPYSSGQSSAPMGPPPASHYSPSPVAPAAGNVPPSAPAPYPTSGGGFPDLPSVPDSSLPPVGGESAGPDDLDFDDLTRRFEDLKRKK